MTDDRTSRLELPLLYAEQAQKEMTHNEALALLDLLVQPVAQSAGINEPPAQSAVGDCWIVGAEPTGAWTGHQGSLAGMTQGGWRHAAPQEGMRVWVVDQGVEAVFMGGAWRIGTVRASTAGISVAGVRVLGEQGAGISVPQGGAIIDVEARTAIASVIAALRAHGLVAT